MQELQQLASNRKNFQRDYQMVTIYAQDDTHIIFDLTTLQSKK
jgi:hypothetical protein